MKLVQDLPEIFEEFGEKRREAFLEVCFSSGGSPPYAIDSHMDA